jgi:hypothetical protein
MNLGHRAETVLVGVYKNRERLVAMDIHAADHWPAQQRGAYRQVIQNAQGGLVRMNLAGWLDREPTPSDRVMFHHEFIRLEGLGLLERHNIHGGSRTTHLKLTAEGERLARELLDEDAANEVGNLKLEDLKFLPIEWPQADGSVKDQDEENEKESPCGDADIGKLN